MTDTPDAEPEIPGHDAVAAGRQLRDRIKQAIYNSSSSAWKLGVGVDIAAEAICRLFHELPPEDRTIAAGADTRPAAPIATAIVTERVFHTRYNNFTLAALEEEVGDLCCDPSMPARVDIELRIAPAKPGPRQVVLYATTAPQRYDTSS